MKYLLIPAILLITACGGSGSSNPFAVVDETNETPVSAPEAIQDDEPVIAAPIQVEPAPAPVSTPVAVPVEAEPVSETPEQTEAPASTPDPIAIPVFATPDPFIGVNLVCTVNGNPVRQFTLNEDGTYIGRVIPPRGDDVLGVWTFSEGVVFLDGFDYIIGDGTLTRDSAVCAEGAEVVSVEQVESLTHADFLDRDLECLTETFDPVESVFVAGDVDSTLRLNSDGTFIRTTASAATSGQWELLDDGFGLPGMQFLFTGETITWFNGNNSVCR